MDEVPSADPPRDADTSLDALIKRLDQQMHDSPPTSSGRGPIIAAGHPSPSPASLDDIGIAHAIDGDGTAFCRPQLRLEQIDNCYWHDLSNEQRCPICVVILDR